MGIAKLIWGMRILGNRIRPVLAMGMLGILGVVFSPMAEAANVGEQLTGTAVVGGVSIPLPDGTWTVYYAVDEGDPAFPTSKLGLAQLRGKVIKQTVYLRVSRSVARAGFEPYPYCEQPHYFFAEKSVNEAGNRQNCWHVRAESLAVDDAPSDRYQALLHFSKANGYFLPLTLIGSRFHIADRNKSIRVSIGWNPDLILRAPEAQKVWRFQDWTAEAVAADPRKRVIMSKFKRWSDDWRPNVEGAFGS